MNEGKQMLQMMTKLVLTLLSCGRWWWWRSLLAPTHDSSPKQSLHI